MSDKEKVFSWIENHEDEMVDFLKEYVRYKSPSGKEEEVQKDFLKPFFEEKMDWDEVELIDKSEENNRPNVNARFIGNGDGKNLLFNGHSDVVDVSEEKRKEKWEREPWDPILENGKLYGRGVNDMKGGNAAVIWAICSIMDLGIRLEGDLMLSLVVGEESAEQELGSIAATKAFQNKGIEIPFCVNAEPTNNEIHTKSAGTFDFRISISGKGVHTSQKNLTKYPQRYDIPVGDEVGVDAVPIMIEVLEKLEELEHEWNMRYRDKNFGGGGYPNPDAQGVGPIAICCTMIEAGEYISTIPGDAEIKGQIYYPPFVEDEKLWNEMKNAVKSLESTNDWLKKNPIEMKCKEEFDWPPYSVPADHPGCEALANSVREVRGEEPVFSAFKAVADNAYIQKECGIETVSIGPGNLPMGTHGADEYLPLDQFVEVAKIYATMILNWCR